MTEQAVKLAIGLGIGAGVLALADPEVRAFASKTFGGTLGGRMSAAAVKSMAQRVTRKWTPTVPALTVRTIVEIESSRNPTAYRNEPHINDASIGLMQTLHATALFLYDSYGARGKPRPTDPRDLLDPETSMYFGANYLEYLQSYGGGHSEEWVVRAYNGGPGAATASSTLPYWRKFTRARDQILAAEGGF